MRTQLVSLLLCWSSLALALGDPCTGQVRSLPQLFHGKHAFMSGVPTDQPTALPSRPFKRALAGYSPWAVQATGFPSGHLVFSHHAVSPSVAWAVSATGNAERTYTRTTDGGLTWLCDTVHTAGSLYCVRSVFAADADRAWIAMHYHGTARGGGIFKTTDGGTTWQQDPTAFTPAGGYPDFIHFFDSDNGICVGDPTDGYFEIYTTSNGGDSWSRVPQGSIPPMQAGEAAGNNFFTAAGSSLWFPTFTSSGGTGRFFRTTDRGLTWSSHVYPEQYPGWFPTLGFRDDNNGLGNSTWGEVSRTTDGGLTWTRISSPPHLAFQYIVPVPGSPDMYMGAYVLEYPSLEESWIFGTAYSLDGGVNWTMACDMAGLPYLDFASASAGWSGGFDPNIGKWTLAQGKVINVSRDTLRFRMLEAGKTSDTIAIDAVNLGSEPLTVSGIVEPGTDFILIERPSLPVVLPPLGSVRVKLCFRPHETGAVHDSLVIVSDASNAPRIPVALEGRGLAIRPALSGTIYAISASLYAVDPATGTPTAIGPLESRTYSGMAIEPSKQELYGVVAGNVTSLYRICCESAGALPVQSFPLSNLRAVTFSPNGDLYGAKGGRLYRLDLATGDTLGIGTTPNVTYLSIAFSPVGKLWASVSASTAGKDAIYTINTTTGEATLVGLTGGRQATPSIFFDDQGALYGLKVTIGRPDTVISIDTLSGAGTMLFSTGISNVKAMTMASTSPVGDVSEAQVPMVSRLQQNYPNPFNPSTTIRYELSRASDIRLVVFDMLGREVVVLVREKKAAGAYEAVFDASGLSSGVYFYRLHAGELVQTKKMVIVK